MYMRTDDPERDYDRYDAECEDRLDRLPRCIDCGEPIQDEYLYDLNGDIFCEECLKNNFRKNTEDYCDDN